MDAMDTDDTVYVADTPERTSKQMHNERNGAKGKSHISYTSLHSGQHNFLHEGAENQPLIIDSGSRKIPSCPPKFTSSSRNYSDSSSKNAPLFRKGITNNAPSQKTRDSIQTSSKPSSRGGTLVNPTEREHFVPAFGRNRIEFGVPEMGRPGFEKRSILPNGPSRGKEKVEFDEYIQNKPTVSRQKRLVRNGCISPNNIAKGKELSVKEGDSDISHNSDGFTTSSGQPVSVTIRELVAEEISHNGKGKGVMIRPFSSKELDSKNRHSVDRSSISLNDKGKGKRIEEVDGWRSTRNRTKKMIESPNNEEISPIQHQENRSARSEKVKKPNLPVRPAASHHRARLGSSNGHQSAASSTLIKRRKPVGSTLSGYGECSSSVADDQEVLFLSSSNSRSVSSNVHNNLEPIIELDEFSPELRRNLLDEEARSRQLEADEAMARELQEQLYSEGPAMGVQEVDEYIARSLQNMDDETRYFASASPPVSEVLGGSLIPNTRRSNYSRSMSNFTRRVSQSRSSPSGRMTRLRGRVPGQPRTMLTTSRGRASIFPANMDIDMRMHILGTLEAFSDIGMGPGILEAERDFNESDYETLLALDENNDQHCGAPAHRINSLPQSTVQNDNFDEACAVCLETPVIGDTIRHLPCLHRFHKDCIDPWLRRKTSCPICKSSIT